MVDIAIDKEVKQECIESKAWKCRQYNDNLKVITAFWDWLERNDLSASFQDYEKTIWLEDRDDGERDVEPDFFFSENGESHILGEFKGTVSDFQVEDCIEDIEKYCSEYYTEKEAIDIDEASSKTAKAVFFLTHSDHTEKVKEEFEDKNGGFVHNGVPVLFLSYDIYKSSGGQDKLRIEFIEGETGESIILNEIVENGLKNPDGNKEYDVRSLTMYRHTKSMHFYAHKPPNPYLAEKMMLHLRTYQDANDPSSFSEDTQKVSKEEVLKTFKDKYSSRYTQPAMQWIKNGLDVLEEYEWVMLDGDTIKILWEEFTKNRRTDDMYKYFAKEECKEKAKEAAEKKKEKEKEKEKRQERLEKGKGEQSKFGNGGWI